MSDFATIQIKRYRDKSGEPTCSAGKGSNCDMLEFHTFGLTAHCRWVVDNLERRDDGSGLYEGTLIPAEGCPVWQSV